MKCDMSYARTTFSIACFLSVCSCHRMSTITDANRTTASPERCLHVCNCSAAAAQETSVVHYSISCKTSPACLPLNVIAITQSVRLTGSGISVASWTCELARLPLLMWIELDLSSNNISDVLSWKNVAVSLRNLSVAGNRIRYISATTFAGLDRLRHLDVSANDVVGLSVGCFRHMRRLQTLNLIDNSISHLPRGAFDGLSSLIEVRLDGNRMTSLGDGVLAPLTQLTVLSASRNQLREVDARSFNGGPRSSLQQVDLGWNLFDDLIGSMTPALSVLRRLHSLTLDGNPTAHLRADGGRDVWSVRRLSVSHMPTLIAIHRGALASLSQLTTLTIANNPRLRYIDNDALPTGNTLRMLYLHNNSLTSGNAWNAFLIFLLEKPYRINMTLGVLSPSQ